MSQGRTVGVLDQAGDFAATSVPEEERKGFASILWINAGYTINLGCVFSGAALALMLPLNKVFIVLAVSTLIQAAIAVPIGAIGARHGLSTPMLAREAYGRYGSWLVALTLTLSLGIFWFGWQVALFADTIGALAPGSFMTSKVVACIWGGALMVLTATLGFKGMGVLSFIAVPMMITFFAYGTISALDQANLAFGQLLSLTPAGTGTIAQGITMAVGGTAAGAIGMADITRYAKNPAQAGISGTIGYLGGALFCYCAGAFIIVVSEMLLGYATSNLVEAMLSLGLGAGALIMLILAQWTTNDNNLYSGALGLTSMFKMKRSTACIIMGTVGIIIAIAGVQDYFVPFATMLGFLVPPMGGVILGYYSVIRPMFEGRSGKESSNVLSGVNIIALIATVFAAILSHQWVTAAPPPVIGIVSASIVYVVLTVIFKKANINYTFGEHARKDLEY
jgi:cytosine permease